MNISSQSFRYFLFLALSLMANTVFAESTLSQQLAACAALDNDHNRLACYDKLSKKNIFNVGKVQGEKFIHPPPSFLDSHLVAVRWKAEYSLTVRSFVDLIAHAVMENNKPVTVQGWSKDKKDYVLHIRMKKPVALHFFPRQSAAASMPMSLLRNVIRDGYTLDADQFIMIVAAMVPP